MINIERALVSKRFIKAAGLFLRYSTIPKLMNLLKAEYERLLRRPTLSCRPYFIKIQPTNICNAGCMYCLKQVKGDDSPPGKMALGDCKKIIDRFKKYAYLIGFQYSGEPLGNESIFEMVEYAHQSGIGTYLSTNLQEVKDGDCDKLISSGLDLLTIAIDGITQETYGRYRQRGDIAKVIENMQNLMSAKKRLKKISPFITLQFIVHKYNQHEIEGVRQLAKKTEVDNLELKPIGAMDKAILPENKKLYRRIYVKKTRLKRKACWWLWGALVILWNGRVLPCCHIVTSKTELNAFTDDIFSIINNPFNRQVRGQSRREALSDAHPCYGCLVPYGGILQQTI
ncbi:MAG: radical SAM protein [Candidatus Omnitrophota bacterium]